MTVFMSGKQKPRASRFLHRPCASRETAPALCLPDRLVVDAVFDVPVGTEFVGADVGAYRRSGAAVRRRKCFCRVQPSDEPALISVVESKNSSW